MNHSNICYILKRNPETKEMEFVEVDGITVKNSYGFDLFRHKHASNKYFTVTEGQTGFKICDIRKDIKGDGIISSPKEIDAYLESFNNLIDKKPRYEVLKVGIEQATKNYGLSPRYMEPEKQKEPKPKKETNPDIVFSKCLYEKGKKYFILIFNLNGIQLFKRKDCGDEAYFTIYASCNGWMITLGQATQMNTIIDKLMDGFDIHNWLVDSFNEQMSDQDRWVDLGVADYLGRREEAEQHNAPIKAIRDEERRAADAERENKRKARKKEAVDKYNNALKNAENKIKNNDEVSNDTIEALNGNESTVILELMKKHNINVPIKTKGWINNALVRIMYKDGEYTYSYYKSSANSTVFRKYLIELVSTIELSESVDRCVSEILKVV